MTPSTKNPNSTRTIIAPEATSIWKERNKPVKKGHNVVLACHDEGYHFDFVSSFFREGEPPDLNGTDWEQETEYPGTCTVYRLTPEDLFPDELTDDEEEFAEELEELDSEELEQYVELEFDTYVKANRESLNSLIVQFGPDVIHASHAVMVPYIVRPVAERFDIPYFVTIFEESLDFDENPEFRFVEYAIEGLDGAEAVFCADEDVRSRLFEMLEVSLSHGHSPIAVGMSEEERLERLAGIKGKVTLLPDAVDTDLFKPPAVSFREDTGMLIEEVERRSAIVRVGDFRGKLVEEKDPQNALEWLRDEISRINSLHPGLIADDQFSHKLDLLSRQELPFLIFLGELVETSGVQFLIPALPLIAREYPEVRFVICGTGELRGLLELMISALNEGELRNFKRLCKLGNELYPERIVKPFGISHAFLDELVERDMLEDYVRLCYETDLHESIIFSGHLTMGEYAHLLPHARALVVPTLLPGGHTDLFIKQAMAAGVVPLTIESSGMNALFSPLGNDKGGVSVGHVLENEEQRPIPVDINPSIGPGLIFRLAEACNTALGLSAADSCSANAEEMRSLIQGSFSWETVASMLIDHYERASRSRGT